MNNIDNIKTTPRHPLSNNKQHQASLIDSLIGYAEVLRSEMIQSREKGINSHPINSKDKFDLVDLESDLENPLQLILNSFKQGVGDKNSDDLLSSYLSLPVDNQTSSAHIDDLLKDDDLINQLLIHNTPFTEEEIVKKSHFSYPQSYEEYMKSDGHGSSGGGGDRYGDSIGYGYVVGGGSSEGAYGEGGVNGGGCGLEDAVMTTKSIVHERRNKTNINKSMDKSNKKIMNDEKTNGMNKGRKDGMDDKKTKDNVVERKRRGVSWEKNYSTTKTTRQNRSLSPPSYRTTKALHPINKSFRIPNKSLNKSSINKHSRIPIRTNNKHSINIKVVPKITKPRHVSNASKNRPSTGSINRVSGISTGFINKVSGISIRMGTLVFSDSSPLNVDHALIDRLRRSSSSPSNLSKLSTDLFFVSMESTSSKTSPPTFPLTTISSSTLPSFTTPLTRLSLTPNGSICLNFNITHQHPIGSHLSTNNQHPTNNNHHPINNHHTQYLLFKLYKLTPFTKLKPKLIGFSHLSLSSILEPDEEEIEDHQHHQFHHQRLTFKSEDYKRKVNRDIAIFKISTKAKHTPSPPPNYLRGDDDGGDDVDDGSSGYINDDDKKEYDKKEEEDVNNDCYNDKYDVPFSKKPNLELRSKSSASLFLGLMIHRMKICGSEDLHDEDYNTYLIIKNPFTHDHDDDVGDDDDDDVGNGDDVGYDDDDVGGRDDDVGGRDYDSHILKSQIVWSSLNPHYNFNHIIPINNISINTTLQRLKHNYIVTEVWNKSALHLTDQLLGVVKLPLHQFFLSFQRHHSPVLLSSFPVIGYDCDFSQQQHPQQQHPQQPQQLNNNTVDVVDVISGLKTGDMHACIFMGTYEQVLNFQATKTIQITRGTNYCAENPSINRNMNKLYMDEDMHTINEMKRMDKLNKRQNEERLKKKGDVVTICDDGGGGNDNHSGGDDEENGGDDDDGYGRDDDEGYSVDKVLRTANTDCNINKSTHNKQHHTNTLHNQTKTFSTNNSNQAISTNQPTPTSQPTSTSQPTPTNQPTSTIPIQNTFDSSNHFEADVCVERAFHLSCYAQHSLIPAPTTYVTYNTSGSLVCTHVASNQRAPIWNHHHHSILPLTLLTHKHNNMIFKVWHLTSTNLHPDKHKDEMLGFVSVNLRPLLTKAFTSVSGCYNLMHLNHLSNGQLKISITPLKRISLPSTFTPSIHIPSSPSSSLSLSSSPLPPSSSSSSLQRPKIKLNSLLQSNLKELERITNNLKHKLQEHKNDKQTHTNNQQTHTNHQQTHTNYQQTHTNNQQTHTNYQQTHISNQQTHIISANENNKQQTLQNNSTKTHNNTHPNTHNNTHPNTHNSTHPNTQNNTHTNTFAYLPESPASLNSMNPITNSLNNVPVSLYDPFDSLYNVTNSFNVFPLNNVPLNNVPLNIFPLNNVPLNNVPLNNVPLNNVPLNNVSLNNVPLNNVPLNNVPLNNVPLNNFSFNDILNSNLTFQQVMQTYMPHLNVGHTTPDHTTPYHATPQHTTPNYTTSSHPTTNETTPHHGMFGGDEKKNDGGVVEDKRVMVGGVTTIVTDLKEDGVGDSGIGHLLHDPTHLTPPTKPQLPAQKPSQPQLPSQQSQQPQSLKRSQKQQQPQQQLLPQQQTQQPTQQQQPTKKPPLPPHVQSHKSLKKKDEEIESFKDDCQNDEEDDKCEDDDDDEEDDDECAASDDDDDLIVSGNEFNNIKDKEEDDNDSEDVGDSNDSDDDSFNMSEVDDGSSDDDMKLFMNIFDDLSDLSTSHKDDDGDGDDKEEDNNNNNNVEEEDNNNNDKVEDKKEVNNNNNKEEDDDENNINYVKEDKMNERTVKTRKSVRRNVLMSNLPLITMQQSQHLATILANQK